MFLLDGLTVCCRAKAKGGVKERQYRLKEKINMRKVTLVDLPDSDGEWGGGGGGRGREVERGGRERERERERERQTCTIKFRNMK